MACNLRNRSFLKLLDFNQREVHYLLDLAQDLKQAKYAGTEEQKLKTTITAMTGEVRMMVSISLMKDAPVQRLSRRRAGPAVGG